MDLDRIRKSSRLKNFSSNLRSALPNPAHSTKADTKQVLFSNGTTWLLATVCCKVAILWLYTVVIPPSGWVLASRILMGVSIGYGIIFEVLLFTMCHTTDFLWDRPPNGGCGGATASEVLFVTFNLIIDIAIFLLPLPLFLMSYMPRPKRLAIAGLFFLGLM